MKHSLAYPWAPSVLLFWPFVKFFLDFHNIHVSFATFVVLVEESVGTALGALQVSDHASFFQRFPCCGCFKSLVNLPTALQRRKETERDREREHHQASYLVRLWIKRKEEGENIGMRFCGRKREINLPWVRRAWGDYSCLLWVKFQHPCFRFLRRGE